MREMLQLDAREAVHPPRLTLLFSRCTQSREPGGDAPAGHRAGARAWVSGVLRHPLPAASLSPHPLLDPKKGEVWAPLPPRSPLHWNQIMGSRGSEARASGHQAQDSPRSPGFQDWTSVTAQAFNSLPRGRKGPLLSTPMLQHGHVCTDMHTWTHTCAHASTQCAHKMCQAV